MVRTHDWLSAPRRVAALCGLFALFAAPALGAPQVRVDFHPQGTVKQIRQVTARFAAPIVPLGDPRRAADPFDITCPESGTARWVDSRTWAYEFTRDLPAGVRCSFSLRPGLTSLKGAPVDARTFSFSTGGPAIETAWPGEGEESIDEEQAFVLVLDGEATPESIERHVSFAVKGITERVGVRLLTGTARDAILRTFDARQLAGSAVVLQARQRFPNGATVRLIWGRGVATPGGVATERDQVLEFTARRAFTARLHCDRENPKADCLPFGPLSVGFSGPVRWEDVRRARVVGGGREWTPQPPDDPAPWVWSVNFAGPFPEASEVRIEVPGDLRDDAGRALTNAGEFPLHVKIAPFPPLAKFAARFGILEAQADPTLPVTLRNLEPQVRARRQEIAGTTVRVDPERADLLLDWLRRVNRAKRAVSVFDGAPVAPAATRQAFTLPKPNGAAAFEVVGMPLRSPGLYVVELASPRLGAALLAKPAPMYVPTAALVTNLSAHLKWGRENALVWVTSLDAARPVAGARVTVHDCRGGVLWTGSTDAQGVARVDRALSRDTLPRCYEAPTPPREGEAPDYYDDAGQSRALNALDDGLFVVARTDDDMTFVHSGWNEGIEPWRFQLPDDGVRQPLVAHTVFDRTLLRVGETVHMKSLLRLQSLQGFSAVPADRLPAQVSIRHEGSDQRYDLPVHWDANGAAECTWDIPRGARLGRYQVVFAFPTTQPWADERRAGTFRVEEFRVPLLRGTIRFPQDPLVATSSVPLDVDVQYLAGGPAATLPARLRSLIRPGSFKAPDEFESFVFANGAVREGIERRGVGDDEEVAATPTAAGAVHQSQDVVLDAQGAARAVVTDLAPASEIRDLLVELEYRDPNGEVQTVSSRTPLWPAARLVGIRTEDWASSTDRIAATLAVVGLTGTPLADVPVQVDVRRRSTYSYRKRLVGGFYGYEHVEEIGPVIGTLCTGRTDRRGMLRCEGKPPAEGNLILQAAVTDEAGHVATAHGEVWVNGEEDWRFRIAENDRIDVLPERPRYEPGDTARLQVRMPFREATALVTTEREGVDAVSVVPLSSTDPVIEIPVKDSYAPNMFVSVLVVRGRVGDVQPTAMLDLGRPAYKLGVAEIRVGWRAHALQVSVTPDRATYRVRERAAARIAVRLPDGAPPPMGSEVAVAAVDEGLLELQPNGSWNLLDAMMGRRGYGMQTATAQMQVVGKRHYGLKALPQGGGGGRQATRELFDTLLLWNGRVALDANGDAVVDVPLNDSVTSFRIVAVATAGRDRFGTGSTTIRSTQDLTLFSGIPPLVRDGDRFRAEFTVRNTTADTLNVTLRGVIEGYGEPLAPQTLSLPSGGAETIGWDVTVPAGVGSLRYDVEAGVVGGRTDRLRVTQVVRPAVPVRTVQATLLQLNETQTLPVERPADALPSVGGIDVALAPSLTAGLDGVRQWMRQYPYSCLEQKVSRAVALRDEGLWRDISAMLPSYLDAHGLLKFFPALPSGSDVLTVYVLQVSQAAGLALPADVQRRMEEGLRKFVTGTIVVPSAVRRPDLPLRKLACIDALARVGKADPALLGSITIEPNLWPTSAVLDWWSILRRVAGVPQRTARLREVEHIIRARLDVQGSTMGFAADDTSSLWWLMICPDTNAVRLVHDLTDADLWRDDLPRLARGMLGRQRRGVWDCTVTNAWGALAVEKFVQRFEPAPVNGTSIAALGGATRSAQWAQPPQPVTVGFAWPPSAATLSLEHRGDGAPWATVQSRAAIPLTQALSSGYRIARTVTPVEVREPGRWHRGDILRVRLEIDAQADMTWVVVNDPVPAGAAHLGTGLARDSQVGATGDAARDQLQPSFAERAFDAYRAYYEFVPKGPLVTEYVIRLNEAGQFRLPGTRVEALYAPEMFGELPNAELEVAP